jgi:hypothetical protein
VTHSGNHVAFSATFGRCHSGLSPLTFPLNAALLAEPLLARMPHHYQPFADFDGELTQHG